MTLIEVHNTHGRQIYSWMRRYLPRNDALDARQELYYIWHKQNQIFDPGNPRFMGWLFVCAQNMALRHKQKATGGITTVPLTDYDYPENNNLEVSCADNQAFQNWWNDNFDIKSDYIQEALEKAKVFYFQTPEDPLGQITAYDVISRLTNRYDIVGVALAFEVHTVTIRRWLKKWRDYINAEYEEENNYANTNH